jgi:hypothetical protein
VAVLVRDPSATTPVDVSLNKNRRALYLSQPASPSHHRCHGKPGRRGRIPLPIVDSGPRNASRRARRETAAAAPREPQEFGDPIAAWAAKSSAQALSLVKWVSSAY